MNKVSKRERQKERESNGNKYIFYSLKQSQEIKEHVIKWQSFH